VSVSSIIITYQPDTEILSQLILGNLQFFNQVIIVDNGSINIDSIKKIVNGKKNIKLVELGINSGIATAQNIGLKCLDVEEDELIVFFDQDSSINSDFINLLQTEYDFLDNKYKNRIILGPTFFNRTQKFEYPCIQFNKYGLRKKFFASNFSNCVEVSCIISSGMCVKKKIIDHIGYMKDELFIDYVDTEWCMRASSLGWKIFVSPNIRMEHEIGSQNIKILKWRIPVHTASRRYYRIRNSFYLLKYPYIPIALAMREIIFSVFHQLIHVVFMKNKLTLIKSMIKGILDGIHHVVCSKKN
jgi:rhamnosyltransferase